MSKEIIYRGISITEDDWVYGSIVPYLDGRVMITNVKGTGSWMIKPETIGQFTGLKDKNGKQIWEGDILEVSLEEVNEHTFIGKVVLDLERANFIINLPSNIYPENDLTYWNQKSKVIGNIHQHTELIK